MKKYIRITLLFIISNIGLSYGQVVIGGASYPVEGAILDLKEHNANSENVTGNKGFLLPRVKLLNSKSLIPLVHTDTDANKLEHIGIQVYHVGGGELIPGLKVWNGIQWEDLYSSSKEQWFYMPPFPIKMFVAGEQKVDLYEEYKKQMDTTKSGISLWKESEVTFAIIGYDSIAFDGIPTVSVENGKQMLVYKAALGKMSASSYLNIIVVKK